MISGDKTPEPDDTTGYDETVQITAGGGRYVFRRHLGRGNMGEVYQAFDTRLKRPVALKRMSPRLKDDPEYRRRFTNEAERASLMTSENIAAVYDFFEEGEELYIVMEYVEGKTLRETLHQRLDLKTFLPIASQCANALRDAHESGIVHSDIKPENIMLTVRNRVKFLDFGVAKKLPEAVEGYQTGIVDNQSNVGGTPPYMAPEVFTTRRVDSQTDIYSLGVVFYEALSGENPFRAPTVPDVWDRVMNLIPPPLRKADPEIPRELDDMVQRMISKNRKERFLDAQELIRALEEVVQEASREEETKANRRRLVRRSVAAGVVVAITIGSIFANPSSRNTVLRALNLSPRIPARVQLAVQPFSTNVDNATHAAFVGGLSQSLTETLEALGHSDRSFEVIGQREISRSGAESVADLATQLGANLIMTGAISSVANGHKLQILLYDSSSDKQISSLEYDLPADGTYPSRGDIALDVSRMLEIELSPEAEAYVIGSSPAVAHAEDFYLQGKGYLMNYDDPQNIDNAIEVLQHALSLDPGYAVARAKLGEAYWRKFEESGDREWLNHAREACEMSLATESNQAEGHIALGTIHNGLHEYVAAESEFLSAIELDPTSDDAYRGLAAAHQGQGDAAQAEGAFRRAIELHPNYWSGYNWLGSFYARRGRYEEAAGMFRQVVALAPDNALGFSNLGGAYKLLNRYDDALEMFEQSISLRPTHRAYNNLGSAKYTLGDIPGATQAYERALELRDSDFRVWRNLAICYKQSPGRHADATRAYQEAATRAEHQLVDNPQDPILRTRLAEFYAELGEASEAERHIFIALREGGDEPAVLVGVASVSELMGERDRAVELLIRAIELGYPVDQVIDTPGFLSLSKDPRVIEARSQIN